MVEEKKKEKKKKDGTRRAYDIKDIFKFRQTDETGSGGNQILTGVKFKEGVMRTEGEEYQRGLRTKR